MGQQVIDELRPQPGELVIDKGRSTGFIGTNLDMVLRSNKIETIAVAGMATHACVESTARDAGFFDYYVLILEDLVADYRQDLHDASLLTLRQRAFVLPSDEASAVWTQNVQ